MLSFERILVDGGLFSLVMSALVALSLVINPRVWLQDYPEAIRKLAPPLTMHEKRQQRIIMVPFLGGFVVVPFLLTRAFLAGGDATLLTAFLYTFAVLNVFNLFDAVVIDWLFLAVLHPRFALIPEAWGRTALLLDYRKAIRDYLKGIVFCAVFGLIIAGTAILTSGL